MKMSTHFCGQSQVLFKSTRNRTPFSLSPFSFRMAKTGTPSPHTHTWLKQNGQPGMSPPRPTPLAPPSPAVSSGRGGGGTGSARGACSVLLRPPPSKGDIFRLSAHGACFWQPDTPTCAGPAVVSVAWNRHVVNRRLSCATFKGSLCFRRSSCSQGKCDPGGVLNGFVGSVNVKHSEVALREGLP